MHIPHHVLRDLDNIYFIFHIYANVNTVMRAITLISDDKFKMQCLFFLETAACEHLKRDLRSPTEGKSVDVTMCIVSNVRTRKTPSSI